MTYITDMLERDELVAHRARIGGVAYLGAILSLLVTLSPSALTKAGSTELVLTDRRVIGKQGMLVKHRIAVPYKELQRIHVSRGLLGRLLGYGTVTVIARDGRQVKFKGIADPLDLQRRADEFIEMAVLGHRLPKMEELAGDRPGHSPKETLLSPQPPKKGPVLSKMPKDTTTW